jgi:hypothetical protein
MVAETKDIAAKASAVTVDETKADGPSASRSTGNHNRPNRN